MWTSKILFFFMKATIYISDKILFTKYILIFLITGLFTTVSFSQTSQIKLIDSKSNEPVSYATVLIIDLTTKTEYFKVSDEAGLVVNPSKNISVIKISCIGYNAQSDTISAGKSYKFALLPTIFSLDEVVVTGSIKPQRADKSIYNIKVIDRRVIEEKAANNLKDILSSQVNMSISQDPALGSSLKIKGLTGNNVKILIDGVPVIGRMGGNIDLSQLNLYNIDHIEMVEGPMSVIYGSDALAGAINIITKENKISNFGLTANSYYETAGTYNIDGNVNFRRKRHSFSVSGSRNYFNGFSTDTLRSQPWKPKEQYSGEIYYMYTHDKAKIKYQVSYMNEKLWDKGNLLEPRYYTAFDSWFYSKRLTNRFDYERNLDNDLSIRMLASYSLYQRSKITYLKDLSTLSSELSPNSADHDTTDFSALVYRFVLGKENPDKKLNYTLGLDINHEKGTGKRIVDNKQAMGDYALFASIKYNPLKTVILQPGMRMAYNTSFSVPLVPSLNIRWEPSERFNIRASYARGYRAPTLKELYIYFVDVNHNIQPNENLKAEYGHNYDFSISYNTEKNNKIHYSDIDFGLFYNNMHNIIQLAIRNDIGNNGAYQYINVLNYNTLGYQTSLSYNFYPYLDVALGFGHTGTYFSFDESKQKLSDYKFSGDINANIGWSFPALKLKLAVFYKYTDRSWLFSVDENNVVKIGKMSAYHNLDLTILRKFLSNRLIISTGVKNILNNTNINIFGNVATGVHTSDSGNSPVSYGRLAFLKISYTLMK
jgi:outer membrane receptor for ferrienterochelin and colicins